MTAPILAQADAMARHVVRSCVGNSSLVSEYACENDMLQPSCPSIASTMIGQFPAYTPCQM